MTVKLSKWGRAARTYPSSCATEVRPCALTAKPHPIWRVFSLYTPYNSSRAYRAYDNGAKTIRACRSQGSRASFSGVRPKSSRWEASARAASSACASKCIWWFRRIKSMKQLGFHRQDANNILKYISNATSACPNSAARCSAEVPNSSSAPRWLASKPQTTKCKTICSAGSHIHILY